MRECWHGLPEAASAADILCSLSLCFVHSAVSDEFAATHVLFTPYIIFQLV